jgi:beta-xylosidase
MIQIIRIIYLSLLLGLCASAQPPQATYTNPVIPGDFPDPSVIRVGENYWATTTSGNWEPHFPILHSRDLVNWRIVGAVFQKAPAWAARDFWAPQFIADKGRFFVYYTARKIKGPLCVAVATADRPEGPYTDRGPLVCQDIGSIDAFMVRDENDRPYLIWKEDGNSRDKPTPIWAQQLAEDGTKLLGKPKEILRNTAGWENHVVEGSYILRRGGWFYHFYSGNACCGRGCKYALGVARSRKLLGPWEKNPANPIVAANEAWQCPGHGDIVSDPEGRDFLLYHAYRARRGAVNIGREALLDEVSWGADGWPSVNGGRGPGSTTAEAPLPLAGDATRRDFFDGFTSAGLGATWQWPMFNEQVVGIQGPGGGYLLLSPRGSRPEDFTSAIAAQPSAASDYVATTLVNLRDMPATMRAGLAAYGWPTAALGISVGGGKIVVWRREEKNQETPYTADAPRAEAVYLRMTATEGERYSFSYSTNGRDWTALGAAVGGSHIEGVRVALTASGAPGATAKFDWLRITPTQK